MLMQADPFHLVVSVLGTATAKNKNAVNIRGSRKFYQRASNNSDNDFFMRGEYPNITKSESSSAPSLIRWSADDDQTLNAGMVAFVIFTEARPILLTL